MCLHTSTQLYYRSRESKNEIAKIILATSQMISTFSSDFFVFILLFQFKSEPAQTLMSEVFYSRPIKALSQRVDQTFGKQMNKFGLGIGRKCFHILLSKLCQNIHPLADVFNIDTTQEAALLREYFSSPRLSGKNFERTILAYNY